MTRWMVSGAQGFVGRYLISQLLATRPDSEVLGVGRSPETHDAFTHTIHAAGQPLLAPLPEALLVTSTRYRYRSVDICSRSLLRPLLQDFRPHVFVHLASRLRDDEPEQLFRTNVEGTIAVLEQIAECDTRLRIVAGSSAALYGAPTSLPITEDTPPAPCTLYGASKLAAEAAARVVARDRGLDVVFARMFNLVGGGQDERHVCGRLASQIAAITAHPTASREVHSGDLTTTRDFIDVRDVAAALIALGERGVPGEAYNLASGHETAIMDVYTHLLRCAGLDPSVHVFRSYNRAGDVSRIVGDRSKLEGLGIQLRYNIESSLRDLLAYYHAVYQRVAAS